MTEYALPEVDVEFYVDHIWAGRFVGPTIQLWYYYKIINKPPDLSLSLEELVLNIDKLGITLQIPRLSEVITDEPDYIPIRGNPELVNRISTYADKYVDEHGVWPEEVVTIKGKLRLKKLVPMGIFGIISEPRTVKEYDITWSGPIKLETFVL